MGQRGLPILAVCQFSCWPRICYQCRTLCAVWALPLTLAIGFLFELSSPSRQAAANLIHSLFCLLTVCHVVVPFSMSNSFTLSKDTAHSYSVRKLALTTDTDLTLRGAPRRNNGAEFEEQRNFLLILNPE